MELHRAAPIVLLLLLGLLVVPSQQLEVVDDDDLDSYPAYESPVRTADEDQVQELPGLSEPINFNHYSGYLQADDGGKKFLHYWFVESQSGSPAKDPVLLWLNGGPGCSSLGGMFTELGPFQVKEDGKTLALNPFSWNRRANVLFLESPAGVGFSYSTSLLNVNTDDSTARENHLALKSFMRKFPQFANNSLYLSGESYAGVYLPTLGVLVDADPELNLKGIAIGNGYLDVAKLADSAIFFSYHHGLIGKTTWDKISEHCCGGKPPARDSCNLSGSKSSWSCAATVAEVTAVLQFSGLNPYNLYGQCLTAQQQQQQQRQRSNREIIDRALMELALNSSLHHQTQPHKPFHVFDARSAAAAVNNDAGAGLRMEPPCFDDHTLIHYLNTPAVRKAIHIPKKVGAWDTCSLIVYVMKYPKLPGGLAPQMKQLIESKRNLRMLVYNGDVDMVCNFLGDEWFVDDLGRDVIADYSLWKVGGQVAGFVKHYDGITYATVRGSGHMVPGDRPREALAMISIFLNQTTNYHEWP